MNSLRKISPGWIGVVCLSFSFIIRSLRFSGVRRLGNRRSSNRILHSVGGKAESVQVGILEDETNPDRLAGQ